MRLSNDIRKKISSSCKGQRNSYRTEFKKGQTPHNKQFNFSREELHRLYIGQNLSSPKIANMLGFHKSVILCWLRKYNISRRSNSEASSLRRLSKVHRLKISISKRGGKHWNWKGGSIYYYGENWDKQRKLALERMLYKCEACQNTELLDVHHIIPFKEFASFIEANELTNLMVLCKSCHMKVEMNGGNPAVLGLER